jgi:hypothetical protein
MNLKGITLVVAISVVLIACVIAFGPRPAPKTVEVFDPLNPSLTALLPESAAQVVGVRNAKIATELTESDVQQLAKLVGRIQGIRYEILGISPMDGSQFKFQVKVPDHFVNVERTNNQWRLVSIARYIEVAN